MKEWNALKFVRIAVTALTGHLHVIMIMFTAPYKRRGLMKQDIEITTVCPCEICLEETPETWERCTKPCPDYALYLEKYPYEEE